VSCYRVVVDVLVVVVLVLVLVDVVGVTLSQYLPAGLIVIRNGKL
jgi:hypothetical protein